MKKILFILSAALLSLPALAQAPSKMSYQAVVRNASNALVINRPVSMRVSILRGSISGIPVYVETQTSSTNDNGLMTMQIGDGVVQSGNLDSIDWSSNQYFIKTETDPNGGVNYSITGTSQLLSVPYALFAKSSGSSIPGPQGPAGTAGLTTSVNNIQQVGGNITLNKSDLGLNNVDNTADLDKPIGTDAQAAFNLKADITSPTLTGTPLAPTAAPGTNTNQMATTAFVQNAVSNSMATDATTSSTGKVQLAGDLGGAGSTAAAPIISNNAITSAKIQNGTITGSDISSSAAIPFSKLNISYANITSLGIPGTDTQYGAGTGLSLSGTTFSIDPSVLTNNYPGTVTANAFAGDGSQLTGVAATSVANNSVTGAKIVDGTIGNADISSSAAIPFSKLNISYADITSLGIPGTDTQYGAGTGISLSGNTFSIDASVITNNFAGTVTANAFAGNGSQLTGVAATSVANNSVTGAKIVDGTIGNADISSSAAIPFSKLNISYSDITGLGIPATDTQYGAGTGISLSGTTFSIDPSVVTNNYSGTVTANAFIGDGSQLTGLAAATVANNSVTSAKIVDGTIANADISSSAAIPFTKLNISYGDITSLGIPGTDTQYGAGTGISLSGTTFSIDPSVVTNNYSGTVTANAFVGDGSQLSNIIATSVDDNIISSSKIVNGSITNVDISPSAAIPFTKLNISYGDITSLGIPGTDTQYGAGTGMSLSGTTFSIDPSVVTNNYSGTVTATGFIGDGSQLTGVGATSVANNSVTSAKIVDGTIGNADISSSAAIPFTKLNISYGDITSLGIPGTDTDTQYGAGTGMSLSGTTFSIDPSVVTNNYSGTVTATGFIGDGSQLTSVAATSVANNSVTSAKIVDGTIGNADISSSAAIPFTKLNISYSDITSLGIPGTDTDTQYGAGTGMSLSGTTFSIDPSVVTNNYSGTVTATGFIGDGSQLTSVAATSVANNSVTSAKIVDGTISNADISSSAAIPFSKLNFTKTDLGVYSSMLTAAGSVIQSSVTANPTHTNGTGIYQISYPTVTFTAPILTATLQSLGFITATYSGGGVFTINTYDITGTPADLDFSMIVMEP